MRPSGVTSTLVATKPALAAAEIARAMSAFLKLTRRTRGMRPDEAVVATGTIRRLRAGGLIVPNGEASGISEVSSVMIGP
jgi:exopolyphosphatase/pppGpp-phosphohydrolase